MVQENIDGQEYYTLELDEHVIFPIKAGAYAVNPFKMDIVEGSWFLVLDRSQIKCRLGKKESH